MSAITTSPKLGYNAPFAGITEEVDQQLRRVTPAADMLWRELRRNTAPGATIEANLQELAEKLDYSVRWIRSALTELISAGLVDLERRFWNSWFRVRVHDPGIVHKTSIDCSKNGKKQPSNTDSLVTYSLKSLKKEQTGEFSLENSPLQKEGLRSPLPKPKPRNQDLEPEPDLTKALGLIAEYGNRTGDRNLETKSRVRKSIANIARNLSPEKLLERVRNAIAATEQTRLKGALQKPIECLLSAAISRGITPNVSKPKAAAVDDHPLENGAGRVYCAADFDDLGIHQAILPVGEVGHLINPPTPDSQLPNEINPDFSDGIREKPKCQENSPKSYPEFSEGVSTVETERQVICSEKEPPIQPSERRTPNDAPSEPIDVGDLIALSRSYEQDLGITPGDRVSTIESLIGATVSHPSRLTDSQLLDYVRRLKELADKDLRRSP